MARRKVLSFRSMTEIQLKRRSLDNRLRQAEMEIKRLSEKISTGIFTIHCQSGLLDSIKR
jgi:hypothetical protein